MAANQVTARSLDMLRDLYSVIVGLALVGALGNLIEKSPTADVLIHWDRFYWFGATFVTILPFYHGALRYLDDVYMFAQKQPKPLVFFVDYLLLFAEACLMVGLGLLIAKPESFMVVFSGLLMLDVVWAIVSYFSTDKGTQNSWKWVVVNCVTLLAIAVLTWTSVLDKVKPKSLLCLVFIRTIVDYLWTWRVYFPE